MYLSAYVINHVPRLIDFYSYTNESDTNAFVKK